MENFTIRGDMLSIEGLSFSSSVPAFAILFFGYIFIMASHISLLVLILRSRSLQQPMYLLLCNMVFNDAFGATIIIPQFLRNLSLSPSDRLLHGMCHSGFVRSSAWQRLTHYSHDHGLRPLRGPLPPPALQFHHDHNDGGEAVSGGLGFSLPPGAGHGGPQRPPVALQVCCIEPVLWQRIFVQAVLRRHPA